MQVGLSDHVWNVDELIEHAFAAEPCERPEPCPLAPRPDAPKVTTKTTPTGVKLLAMDGGKAPKPVRQKAQVDIWDVLKRAKERENEPPDDTPSGDSA